VKFGADFVQQHIIKGKLPEPVTLNGPSESSFQSSNQSALAMRQELMRQAAEKSIRKMDHKFRGESNQDQFVRIIRDGVAEEVKSAIIETRREIELSAKQGKLTQITKERAKEFNESSKAFLQYKLLLEKLENSIESYKDVKHPAALEELESHKKQAAKVQKLCVKSGDKVIQLREAIEKQIQAENKKLQNLLNSFKRCKNHLPKLERGKLEVSVTKVMDTAPMEDRIQFLTKLITKLAQSVPQIRLDEVGFTYQEALTAFKEQRYDDTLKELNQLFHFDNKHIKAHRLRAELFRVKNNKIALQAELKTIAEYPNAEGSDFFTYAESLMINGHTEEAFQLFQKAVKYDQSKDYLKRLGDTACLIGQWFHAEKAYNRLLSRFPDEIQVQHDLVKVFFEDNRIEQAYEQIQRLHIEHNPHIETYVYLGRILRYYKALPAARKAFECAVEMDMEHIDANYWLSQTEYDMGDFNAALAFAQNVNDLEPERSRNLLLLAKCLSASGKQEKALECLQPMLDDKTPHVDILLAYSETCRMVKLETKAINPIKSALEKIPWQPMLKTEYGLLQAGLGNMEEAIKYLGS
jgi:tetratricopeptide (TPR) repeat protein